MPMKIEGLGKQFRQVLPMFSVFFLCLLIGVSVHQLAESGSLVPEQITAWLSHFGLAGWLAMTLVVTLAMVAGFPRQMVAFFFGGLLGAPGGVLLSLAACCLSCITTFWVARRFLSGWVESRFPHGVSRIRPVLEARPYAATLAIRLFPIGSNALTNLVAGVTPIRPKAFVLASAVGYLPQLIIFALLGAGIEQVSAWQFTVSLSLFIFSVGLSVHIYRWYYATLVPASRS